MMIRYTVLLLLASCGLNTDNSNFCPGRNANNNCSEPADEERCESNGDCTGALGVCNVASGECVACLENSDCDDATAPICSSDNTCAGCVAHADCDSNACLPDGSCGDDTTVAYVNPEGTDNDQCTQSTPCISVADALATTRPFVKFTGTTDEAVEVSNQRVVTFLAGPGAKLTRGSGGAILTVRDDGTALTIFDLSISDGPNNASGIGVLIPAGAGNATVLLERVKIENNPGGGINSQGGNVTVAQSQVSGNSRGGIVCAGGIVQISRTTVSFNPGGGVLLSETGIQFDLTNNFIVRNGADTSDAGGIVISTSMPSTSSRLMFNTIADNKSGNALTAGGVHCAAANFSAANNIVTRNLILNVPAQTSGVQSCTFPSSLVQDDVSGLDFEDPDLPAPLSYKIGPKSLAMDAASMTEIVVDNEGDLRPQGQSSDIGADEFAK